MTERLGVAGIHPELHIPIADPHVGISPERKLNVLNSSRFGQILFDAEINRAARIIKHQQNAVREGVVRNQRIAEMEERRQIPVQIEIAA